MAKELHIRIESHIGILTDEFGWLWAGFTAMELEWRLMELPNPEKLVLHINSPGGCVNEGLSIFNRLLDLQKAGSIIEVINEGICYSIATFIAMAATPGHLIAREASLWCPHKPYFPDGSIGGNADELRKHADELDSNEAILIAAYVARTGKDVEIIKAELRNDKVINSSEAKAAGWIDSVVPSLPNVPAPSEQAMAAKPMAFYRPNTNPQNIEMTKDEQKSLASEIVSGLATAWKTMFPGAKNEKENEATIVATAETLEDDTQIYFEGTLAVDTPVFSDEEMTNALASGDYTLKDGRTLTVVDGIVTAITEAAPANSAELEAANAKIAELEAANAALQATANAKDTTITNLRAEAATAKKKTPAQSFGGGSGAANDGELAPFNKAAEKFKAKYNHK